MKKISKVSDLHKSFRVLGNPVRLSIFEAILNEACECDMSKSGTVQGNCVTSIAEKLDLPQPTVSNHVKELINSGLVRAEKRGRNIFLFGASDMAYDFKKFGDFFQQKVEIGRKKNAASS